eukprot:symbB.v1.2.005758.t1/scaffold289.1/size287290/3
MVSWSEFLQGFVEAACCSRNRKQERTGGKEGTLHQHPPSPVSTISFVDELLDDKDMPTTSGSDEASSLSSTSLDPGEHGLQLMTLHAFLESDDEQAPCSSSATDRMTTLEEFLGDNFWSEFLQGFVEAACCARNRKQERTGGKEGTLHQHPPSPVSTISFDTSSLSSTSLEHHGEHGLQLMTLHAFLESDDEQAPCSSSATDRITTLEEFLGD